MKQARRTQKNNCLLQRTKGDVRRRRKSKDEDLEVGERGRRHILWKPRALGGVGSQWGQTGPQQTGLRGQGAEASQDISAWKAQVLTLKGVRAPTGETQETLPSTPVLTRTGRRENPDGQQGGRAWPGPVHHRPAGLTPGAGDPGSDMLGVCEMKWEVYTTPDACWVNQRPHWYTSLCSVICPGSVYPGKRESALVLPLKLKFPEPYNEIYVKLISGAQWSLKWIHNEVHLRGVYRGLEGLIKEVPFLPLTLISWLWHILSHTTHNLRDDMLLQLLYMQNVWPNGSWILLHYYYHY